MYRRLFTLLLTLVVSVSLFAQKRQLSRTDLQVRTKSYPYLNKLIAPATAKPASKNPNFNKLLVILVDFQLEEPDDPSTTGNGQFQLDTDPDYLYSIGSPPYNRQYFETNLEAVEYYYKAVSLESYQLEYDVYPKNQPAYTLPHPMAYYMPSAAGSELFVSRMEEYFKTAFETADQQDPEIDFASYGHYMIIHAGSDWQHDIMGDTPSDLPSFYIRVGEGKEAIVDGGSTHIYNACNVPSTISQDFYTDESGDTPVHMGYGALNAVLAHEFGHSLGFVDLYNVSNYSPAVGSFDIMDSGGSGMMLDVLPNDELIAVEGLLPTLPGAFSRDLVFGDFFRQLGISVDFHNSALETEQSIEAASALFDPNGVIPRIYKLPLGKSEYLLIENRDVDPDGDGGAAVLTALDGRVVLYPTPRAAGETNPTYEYDYLLPSFQRSDGSAIGGGLLVWRVNEDVLYNQGQVDASDGFVCNFNLNTVNLDPVHLGVSVIEADGLNDLGNQYSMYWTGTPYEYFHGKNPILDSNGFFVSWAQSPWRPEFDSGTTPKLTDSAGYPGMYGLYGIDHPGKTMHFNFAPAWFSHTQKVHVGSRYLVPAPIINSGFSLADIPVYRTAQLNLISYDGSTWQDLMGSYPYGYSRPDFPPVKVDCNNDGMWELATAQQNLLVISDFTDAQITNHQISFPDSISTTPLAMNGCLYVTTSQGIYMINDFLIAAYHELPDAARIAGWEDKLIALSPTTLTWLNATSLSIQDRLELPERFGNYEPIIYIDSINSGHSAIFLMANSGNLYRCDSPTSISRIFTNHSGQVPGQVALASYANISPVLCFGAGTSLFALKADGTVLNGFPAEAPHQVDTFSSPLALSLDNSTLVYYPISQSGYLAIDELGRPQLQQSFGWTNQPNTDYLTYLASQQQLLWYYPDDNGNLLINTLDGQTSNPIQYAGFRNGGSGSFTSAFIDHTTTSTAFNAYIYPNPVNNDRYKLRLENTIGSSTVNIYDISGARVAMYHLEPASNNYHDVELSAEKLASGVYILTLENNGRQKRIKFAVQK